MQAVAAAYSLGAAGLAFGLPTGAELKAGAASVQQTSATSLSVTQTSNRAILNWQSFGIAANESVNFVQPGASAVILNRVVGNDPSAIFGRLTANGHVFLTNPNGVLFARGASVDVGGLVASTLAITNDNFMAGRYLFENPGASGRVENFGQLVARDGGSIALIGPQVANGGTISARLGTAVLAAGDRVTLDFAGDGLLQVRVDQAALKAQVANSGLVAADGGRVVMTSGAANALLDTVVNNSGIVRAASVVERNGEIVLTGAQVVNDGGLLADAGRIEASGDLIVNTGTLNASGASGGTIDVSGRFVALGGHVAADGRGDGGSVSVSASATLSLADRVTAIGEAGRGGAITYRSAGSIIETSTGVTDASGAGAGGRIAVDAGGGILSSGTYRAASSAGDGGRIDFTGHGVRLLSATFDASGETRGGLVRLGGAFQGGKTNPDAQGYDLFVTRWGELPALTSAQRLFVNDSSAVDVSSRAGRGGTVVFWSDRETTQLGRINASGAAGGGAVEISSGDVLRHAGLSGLRGAATLLLDPKNIIIGDAETASTWSYSAILGRGYEPDGSLDLGAALEADDQFGWSVALNAAGDRLAVGAPGDDGFGNVARESGSVRLFSFTSTNFGGGALQATIGRGYTGGKNIDLGTALEQNDVFGVSVALNAAGDRLAVGAPNDAGFGNVASLSGSVRLFSFTDTNFSGGALQATIGRGYTGGKNLDLGTALEAGDYFGQSVALNAAGDRLAAGAISDAGFNNVASASGAVRLFSFTDTNFGGGALQATIGLGYTGGKNLALGTADVNDWFGYSVALNAAGDRLAVGALLDDGFGDVATNSGSVRLFSFTDTSFSGGALQATIGRGYTGGKNRDLGTALAADELFGSSVALNGAGDRLAAGAISDAGFNNVASASGAVRLFSFTDTNFGGGALQATIGRGYTGGKNLDLGTALEVTDYFGQSVALNAAGDRLVVGAIDAGFGNDASRSGSVRLFSFADTNFSGGGLRGTIGRGYTGGKNHLDLGTALEVNDWFGSAVALNAAGDRLAVGAFGDDGFGNVALASGSVRLFSFTDTNFSGGALQATIGRGYTGGKNLDLGTALEGGDNFGRSVALNAAGDRLAVGAPQDGGFGDVATNSGSVRLFSFTDTNFGGGALQATIGRGYAGGKNLDLGTALEVADGFGFGVALNAAGDRLAVGAPFDRGFGNVASDPGSVRLFSFADTNFSGGALQATIGRGYTGGKNLDLGASLESRDLFGQSVALNAAGDRLAVGATGDDGFNVAVEASGAVRLFSFTDTNFGGGALQATIGRGYTGGKNLDLGTALESSDHFGWSVALNAAGDRLAVGAPYDNGFGNQGTNYYLGSVRLFSFTNTNFGGGALQATIGRGYTGGTHLDLGTAIEAFDLFGISVALNAAGNRLAVGATGDAGFGNVATSSGSVRLFTETVESGLPAQNLTFASVSPDASITVSRSDLERVLGEGTAVTLQANNDITVANAVSVPGASGGSLTLQAGRSILFNANVTTANGNLTARANDPGADPAHRDAGSGDIVIATGAALNVGTGRLTLAGQRFLNNGGASALQATGAGRWQVWSANPANDTRGGLAYGFKQYNATYGVTGVAGTGNGFLYSLAPSITPGLTGTVTRTYDRTTSATLTAGNYTVTGAVDGDTVTLNNPVSGTYQSPSVGSTITVDVSGIDIASATNGAATVYGYALASGSASGAIGTINPLPVALTGTRAYDGTAVVGGSILSASNLISGDALTVSGSGTLASRNAGNQSITSFGTLALSNTNYTLSGASGSVNVTAAPLTIRADNQSRAVGAENPPLTASLIGLRAGDTAGVVTGLALATTAATGSPAGAYPITPSGASAPNYSISYTNGVLSVTGTTDVPSSPPRAIVRLVETQLAAVVAELNASGSVVDRAQVERQLLDRLGVRALPTQSQLFTLLQREVVRVLDSGILMPGSSQK